MKRENVHTPAAGTATMEPEVSQIAPLKDLRDYKVASGDPDVRGWKVIGRDGGTIGKVNDLLVDTGEMKARYLDVELDREVIASAPDVPGTPGIGPLDRGDGREVQHHVLIPIGMARLGEEHDLIHLDGFDAQDATVLPAYDHRGVNREYETGLRRRLDRGYPPAAPADRDFYEHNLYDEERFYGPRRTRRRLL